MFLRKLCGDSTKIGVFLDFSGGGIMIEGLFKLGVISEINFFSAKYF